MLNGKKTMTPLALGTAALLALSACGDGDDADPDAGEEQVSVDEETVEEDPVEDETAEDESLEDEDDSDPVVSEEDESDLQADPENSEVELPAGGADRVADEDIDPETQGEPTETDFSEEGAEIGFNESAAQNPPVNVYAAPPEITPESGPDDAAEVMAELNPDDVVLLGGREIAATNADGVWVEIELADGFGWVESHLLEGFEGP